MKITVIGATGMVGSRVTAEAVRRNHQVTAVSRRPSAHPLPAGATALTADITSASAPDAVTADADAIVLSVPPALDDDAVTDTMHRLLDASATAGIRVLLVGGAGPLRTPHDPARLAVDDETFVPPAWRPTARASAAQLRACESHSNQNWTYLSPPALLEPGERTGSYRSGRDTLLTDAEGASRISAEDLAVAVLDELERPTDTSRLTVAY